MMKNHSDDTIESVIIRTVEITRSVNVTSYFSPVTLLCVAIATGFFVVYNRKRAHMVRLMSKIPGPPSLPIIGNTVEVNVQHDGKTIFNAVTFNFRILDFNFNSN